MRVDITKAGKDSGVSLDVQINQGMVFLTNVVDNHSSRCVVRDDRLKHGGDRQVTVEELIDLLTKLVAATTFEAGERVTWTGVRTGGPRYGTVHTSEANPDGYYGPLVTIRTDKGGYTRVDAMQLTRV